MSTTVSYKGSTITTVENTTKTLLTQGKYLEANILVTDSGGGGGVTQYDVTQTLTSVTSSTNATKATAGESFFCELTPATGYVISTITVTMGGVDITSQVFKAGLGTKTITANDTYDAADDDLSGYSSVTVNVPTGITPTGTKQISITSNGTTTEDVETYEDAEITVNVPNSYSAGDEGKVVSNGALVSQTSATYTSNNTYDTTTINSVTVSVSGGGATEYEIDLSGIGWEVGAVGGTTNRTYAQNKTSNTARLRPISLIMTTGVQYTYSQNWGNGEWVAQYQCYGANGKSSSAFTVMTSDTVLTSSQYIAVVLRHSNGTTAMSTTDVATIAPKLVISLSS